MKDIKLMKMSIRNFKGIKELDIQFQGRDTDIFGKNATGKTTIKDAFNWLLFNKNSDGKTDFGIKPTDENGEVIHNLETSVEATFDIEGNIKQFKKTLSEVWTRKRGAAEATFSRNESAYFVNAVPKKKTEYTAEIGKLIDEDLFRMIADPLHFNQINWKDRRSILIDICGNISDEDVIASSRDLSPLMDVLKGRSVDEYRSILKRDMKAMNKELESIPAKINEAELAKPFIDDDIEEEKREHILDKINSLLQQKNDITNGAEVSRMKTEIESLKSKSKSIGSDFLIWETDEYKKRELIKSKIHDTEKSIEKKRIQVDRAVGLIESVTESKKKLSEEWDSVFAETFIGSTCPTCGRELPEDQLEEKKRAFNAKKAGRLDDIEERLNGAKKKEFDYRLSKKKAESEIGELETLLIGLCSSLKESEENLKSVEDSHNEMVKDERAKIEQEIESLTADIVSYNEGVSDELLAIDARLHELESEKAKIDTVIASYEIVKKQEERIEFLQNEQVRLSRDYTNLERLLFLTEQFTVTKVNLLTEKINSHFNLARFKLFNQNINGGIEETCVTTYNGIPFDDLNNAMKINIGLDIINTLCRYNGTTTPIFVDNAEAVNVLADTDSQVVRLVVSEDERLKVVTK